MGLSVVVPVMNERESLEPLYSRLMEVLAGMGVGYEVIFVDDGSTDGSFEVLRRLHEADACVRVIRFSRNFGQTGAFAAGFAEARGETIVTLDADLQNDPADIPLLLDKVRQGYDLVSGWRRHRRDPFLTRKLPSRLANRLIGLVTGVRLHDYGCSLKAYRREVVKELRLYGEMHRFIPALASRMGARITEVPVSHYPRLYGRSKYNMGRTFRVIPDVLAVKLLLSDASTSARPFRFFREWATRGHCQAMDRPAYVISERLRHDADPQGELEAEAPVLLAGSARSPHAAGHAAAFTSLVRESMQ
ncbi:MAG TPA: glycosyltransferase family 2 protein [Chloroflexia bacterium]|nr:glycosyltransferase family 2 protein [Chloroflexia bacterium]